MPAEPMTAAATAEGAVWLPPADAAALLGLSVRALQKRARAGRLTRKRAGRRSLYRVSLADVLAAGAKLPPELQTVAEQADALAAETAAARRSIQTAEQADLYALADLVKRAEQAVSDLQAVIRRVDDLAARVEQAAEPRLPQATNTPWSKPPGPAGKRGTDGEPSVPSQGSDAR